MTDRKKAAVTLEGRFLVRIVYDDAKTYDLVGAATEVLGKCIVYIYCCIRAFTLLGSCVADEINVTGIGVINTRRMACASYYVFRGNTVAFLSHV